MMNSISRRIASFVGVAILALILSVSADAQFMNKLTKGLEKAKKTVENIDKALNKKQPVNKPDNNRSSSSATASEDAYQTEKTDAVDEAQPEEESELAQLVKGAGSPYVTPDTRFLLLPSPGNLPTLTEVSEGIFGVSLNEDFLGDDKYGFWTVDGKQLFAPEWKKSTYQTQPEFHDGVVTMRKSADKWNAPFYILNSDGTSKMIPDSKNWFAITNFKDGLALAHGPVGEGKSFYINTKGEKVFPHIVMYGVPVEGIRPLRNGLRAYCVNTEQWGYIDEKGTVKFPANFKEAGDFSEGYAWVVTEDNVKQLIDTTGKSIFRLDDRNSKASEVVDGIFFVVSPVGSHLDYYNLKGEKLLTVKEGNQFFGGYAYIYNPREGMDMNTKVTIIDKDMKPVMALPWEIIEPAEVTQYKPVFNSKGYANVYSPLIYQGSSIILPDGQIVLRRYFNPQEGTSCDNFSPVSEDGYIKGRIFYNEREGGVIMKLNGEIHWIVSSSESMEGPFSKENFHIPAMNFDSADRISFKIVAD